MWSLTSQLVMYYDILRKFNGDLCKCGRVVRAPHLKCGGCMFKSFSDHSAGVVSWYTLVRLLGHACQ